MIGSSCSSDEMEFNSLLKPMSLKEMDLWNNYNYEVSLLAQAIQDPDKLIDFLGNAYSEEKRKSLMLSITIAMKDSEYPPKKINKTFCLHLIRKMKVKTMSYIFIILHYNLIPFNS